MGPLQRTPNIPGLRKGETGVKEFLFVPGAETGTGRDIVLTQKDIRQIQLAKAAVQAGCKILMNHFKLDSINRIVIAGAFGLHIDKESALTIGLFPSCPPENIILVGNAAGHGAYLALVNRDKREEADRIARTVEHIELAMEEEFQKEFLNALLSLPGKRAGRSAFRGKLCQLRCRAITQRTDGTLPCSQLLVFALSIDKSLRPETWDTICSARD